VLDEHEPATLSVVIAGEDRATQRSEVIMGALKDRA
jgi:hypothetical protein